MAALQTSACASDLGDGSHIMCLLVGLCVQDYKSGVVGLLIDKMLFLQLT